MNNEIIEMMDKPQQEMCKMLMSIFTETELDCFAEALGAPNMAIMMFLANEAHKSPRISALRVAAIFLKTLTGPGANKFWEIAKKIDEKKKLERKQAVAGVH